MEAIPLPLRAISSGSNGAGMKLLYSEEVLAEYVQVALCAYPLRDRDMSYRYYRRLRLRRRF